MAIQSRPQDLQADPLLDMGGSHQLLMPVVGVGREVGKVDGILCSHKELSSPIGCCMIVHCMLKPPAFDACGMSSAGSRQTRRSSVQPQKDFAES